MGLMVDGALALGMSWSTGKSLFDLMLHTVLYYDMVVVWLVSVGIFFAALASP